MLSLPAAIGLLKSDLAPVMLCDMSWAAAVKLGCAVVLQSTTCENLGGLKTCTGRMSALRRCCLGKLGLHSACPPNHDLSEVSPVVDQEVGNARNTEHVRVLVGVWVVVDV